ncbi:MAG: insulinase family protein [Muribaculaceae bacterium]|nr:insulinase family protein [Muribaculaceae bacterium]
MKYSKLFTAALCILTATGVQAARHYDTVPGDPLHTKIYTLPNGLKVFMSVNKDRPRIQANIAVRVGGKNDPAETTGLAHYFEHLMFKGTETFGTQDYAAEKPMLDSIESLFETYRHTTDSLERANIYRAIDSISYQASLIAIPNEYDKLMGAIGATGTNAYTSYDVTCFVENIPSNQIENWAKIQSDRFIHPVLRGFHTELETIYEEKNMSLTSDGRKMLEALLSTLYPNHPYGRQTVLGTQEHLKNPSITNVKNYHKQWYVPNNMAICLSGDFDPDQMVDIIEKYFSEMKPNPNLPVLTYDAETPLTEPVKKDIYGKEAEFLYLVWRAPGASHEDSRILDVLGDVLSNRSTGLIDVDVNLPQKTLYSGAVVMSNADYGALILMGYPKEGQSMDEVRDILLQELQKLCDGDFDANLIPAIVANNRLSRQKAIEDNDARVSMYVNSFINGIPWAEEVENIAKEDKITKEDVVRVANKYFGQNNYAALYKHQGEDKNELKIAKPQLTPIATNRDKASAFLTEIQNSEVTPIEPVFVDYERDLRFTKTRTGVPVIYTHNSTNDIFRLTYVYNVGVDHDQRYNLGGALLELAGLKDMSPEQVKNEFYKMACDFYVTVGSERSYVTITGLAENMDRAVELYESLISNPVLDEDAYTKYVDRIEKSQNNAKASQGENFSRVVAYSRYGAHNPYTDDLKIEQLRAMNSKEFLDAIKDMRNYEHDIIYYGPASEKDVLKLLNKKHYAAKKPLTVPNKADKYPTAQPTETIVFVAPYDAKQLYMSMIANRGEKYNPELQPVISMYNEYFGGNMSGIVFQEMRESRSLAYSAGAGMSNPSKADRPYVYITRIATQNDKLMDAIDAFNEIIDDMPQSQAAFDLAKKGLDQQLRTSRTIKDGIAWSYLNSRDLGRKEPANKALFEALPGLTLEDITRYQQEHIKGNTYYYAILGNIEDLDMDALNKLGKVVILTTEDIFGY